jgi:hypothetical protein
VTRPRRPWSPTLRSAITIITTTCAISTIIVLWIHAIHTESQSQGATPVPSQCQYRANGDLPDPRCTPGALAIGYGKSRICRYDDPPRPPTSYTNPLKRRLIESYNAAYGTSLRGYELDHLIPLELGGNPDSVKNLWPEPRPRAYDKDLIENKLHREVCSGQMTLRHAQSLIRHDWRQG